MSLIRFTTATSALRIALFAAIAVLAACGSSGDDDVADGSTAPEEPATTVPEDTATQTESVVEDLPGAGRSAVMARANWPSGYIHAQILHDLMEQLGYDVSDPSANEFAPGPGYEAMARGDTDFWANSWYPGHLSYLEGALPGGTTIGDNLKRYEGSLMPGGGIRGFLVGKRWADENGVTSLDQINDDPTLWGQLDSDGDGKGEIYGCPEDWDCDDIIAATIAFAGWDQIEQTQDGYDAMFADFMTGALAGDPAIIHAWFPGPYLAQALPGETTMWLSVATDSVLDDSNPTGAEGGEEYSQRRDDGTIGYTGLGPDVCTQGPDGCQTGWLAADIEITANAAWAADNPAAEALFEVFKPPLIDIAIAGVELDNSSGSQADVERIAAQWIADNRDLADEWVAAGLAAR